MSAALASLRQEEQFALSTSTEVSINGLCPCFRDLKHHSADFRKLIVRRSLGRDVEEQCFNFTAVGKGKFELGNGSIHEPFTL
jgi:hypothetical protein